MRGTVPFVLPPRPMYQFVRSVLCLTHLNPGLMTSEPLRSVIRTTIELVPGAHEPESAHAVDHARPSHPHSDPWASGAGFMTPTPTPSHPSSPVAVPLARNKPHRRALHRHSTRQPNHRCRCHTQSSALHLLSTHTLRGVHRRVCPSGLRRGA